TRFRGYALRSHVLCVHKGSDAIHIRLLPEQRHQLLYRLGSVSMVPLHGRQHVAELDRTLIIQCPYATDQPERILKAERKRIVGPGRPSYLRMPEKTLRIEDGLVRRP